jgi:outer membrane lipoprotein-sorting protein
MRPAENVEKLIKKLRYSASTEMHDRVLGNILQALDKFEKQKPGATAPNTRRTIMKSPITKLATAAVIIIAVLMGLHVIGPGSVALAEVLEHLERINAYAYKMKMNMANVPGMPANRPVNLEMEVVVAKDIGTLTTSHIGDSPVGETYVVLDEKAIVSIMPNQRQYMRIKLTDEIFEKMQKENGDPRALVKQFTENKYTELGRSIVDGTEVEGFESKDPNIVENILGNVVGRIWVDTATKLPVRCEIEVSSDSGETMMDMTVYGYEWDIEVAPESFVFTIPEDYKLVAEVDLSADEQYHLEILGLFAELTGGKYPSELTVVKVMEEFQNAMIMNFGHPMTEASQSETIQKIMSLQMTGAFYTRLASEGKDPAYYGATVTAEFPHAVLMRWKNDNGTYKVIFGDLSVGEVTPEELEEMEAMPLNLSPTAIKPDPADGDEGTVLTGLKLTWMSGAYAIAHRVYFGSDPDQLTLLGEVTTESAGPATLQRGMTYYWRVNEVQPDGSVVTGELWSFNTGRLVAHWKLDEGAGDTIANAAGTEYNGNIIGDPIWTTGIIGGALEFDSDGDYIEIENSDDLAIRNQITVSAWVKTDKIARRWQAIATKGDRSWRLQGRRSGNALEFSCSGLLVPDNRWGSLYGNTDVDDGQWHHVAGVYDGKRIYLYLDGQVDKSKQAPGKIRVDDRAVFVGNNSQHPDRFWNGLIDDVRIYSYGLTADEVAALSKQ